uniref:hypothetical protein n=1 Tax=Nocardioides jensenii TaxID=1843 RepID=UPI0012F95D8E|nr:hypothetical protein [Nocardioides jensenii]
MQVSDPVSTPTEDNGRQVRERPVLEFGDDLLNDRVIAVTLIGLDHAQGAVGDEGVVTVGREQLALLAAERVVNC